MVLGAAGAPAESPWTVLSPTTFSGAQVSDLPDPKESRTFTLVGPSGTQVVSTNRSTLFSRSHHTEDAQTALEVDVGARSKFRIAVLGVQPHATWLAATEAEATPQNKKWVQQQGLDATYAYVSKIQGTKIQVFSAHQPNDIGLTSLIVVDGTSMGAHIGTPIGALRMGNKSYVLLESNGMITPVAV